MPLHSSHREAFLVSLIPRSRRAVWVVPQHGQSNTEVGRCHGCRVPAGQNRLGRGPSTRRIHGPRRLQLQVICRDNPAALEAQPHAVATVPDLLGGCSYPSPSSTCSVQVPEQSSSSRGREGGVGKGEAAPQGAPASSRECLRVSGAPTPLRGSSPHRRVPPAPRPRRPPASKGSDGAEPRGGGGGRSAGPKPEPRAVGSPVRRLLASRPSRPRPHRSGCGRGGCRAPCRWGRSPGGSRCGSRAGGVAGSPSSGRSRWASRAAASLRSGPGARSGNLGSQLKARSPETRRSRADPSPRKRRPPPPQPWRGARGRVRAVGRELPLPAAGAGDSAALAC